MKVRNLYYVSDCVNLDIAHIPIPTLRVSYNYLRICLCTGKVAYASHILITLQLCIRIKTYVPDRNASQTHTHTLTLTNAKWMDKWIYILLHIRRTRTADFRYTVYARLAADRLSQAEATRGDYVSAYSDCKTFYC